MGIFSNMRKPKGKLGNIQLKSMNKEHTPLALWNLKHLDKKVYGVDYSIESVKLSREVNRDLIGQGKVEVLEGDVQSLPFEDNTFDIITAFETVYFWPNIEKSFGEVKRVLKTGGTFMMGMESNGSDNIPMKISKKLIDMEVYSDDELTGFLKANDYSNITVYLRDAKNREEIIKANGEVKRIKDDYDHASFSDKFLEWMTITAEK